jgi:hypothetical protein
MRDFPSMRIVTTKGAITIEASCLYDVAKTIELMLEYGQMTDNGGNWLSRSAFRKTAEE